MAVMLPWATWSIVDSVGLGAVHVDHAAAGCEETLTSRRIVATAHPVNVASPAPSTHAHPQLEFVILRRAPILAHPCIFTIAARILCHTHGPT